MRKKKKAVKQEISNDKCKGDQKGQTEKGERRDQEKRKERRGGVRNGNDL